MSRHRNIRSMNYSDECEGYDDVYGHSVEEDFAMSPSDAAFMYNRDKPQRIESFFQCEKGIVEEDEDLDESIDNLDKSKLDECIKQIQETLGTNLTITRQQMIDAAVNNDYNSEKSINFLLDNPTAKPLVNVVVPEKKDLTPNLKSKHGFLIPELNFGTNLKNVEKKNSFGCLISKPDRNEIKPQFQSLNALASSHLEKVNVGDFKPNFLQKAKPKFESNKENSINQQINGISSQVNFLKLSKSDITQNVSENLSLDLTNSLILNVKNSQSQLSKISNTNIDVDVSVVKETTKEKYSGPKLKKLNCLMDQKGISKKKLNNCKRFSNCGLVITKSYRGNCSFIPVLNVAKRDKQFNFGVPSPDDLLSI